MRSVSLGIAHTVCLDAEGSLWSCGRNDFGQTGHDTENSVVEKPERISCLPQIHSVACGHFHTVCVDNNRNVWSFGKNDQGQLGHSKGKTVPFPTKVDGLPPVNSVCCGTSHTICLVEDSLIWGFGRNQEGQLGFAGPSEQYTPIQIPNISDVVQIAGGGHQTIVMDGSERLFATGGNYYGQLGIDSKDSKVTSFTQICHDKTVIDFACGLLHSVFLDSEGNVYGVGCNFNGQIGNSRSRHGDSYRSGHRTLGILDHTLQNIEKISCGNSHTMCSDGKNVFMYGDNTYGQCAIQNRDYVHEIEASVLSIGGNHTIIKTQSGSILVCGQNRNCQLGLGKGHRQVRNFVKLGDEYSHIIDEHWVAYRRPGFRRKSARN